MVSNLQKQIYNQWLISSRSNFKKPFKIKKDFEDFSDNFNYANVLKIERLLSTNNVDLEAFFNAPYRMWLDTKKPYTLDYYASRKAINDYNKYLNAKANLIAQDIDNKEFIIRCVNGILHINQFCVKNGIELTKYICQADKENTLIVSDIKKEIYPIFVICALYTFDQVKYLITNQYLPPFELELNVLEQIYKKFNESEKLKLALTTVIKNLK